MLAKDGPQRRGRRAKDSRRAARTGGFSPGLRTARAATDFVVASAVERYLAHLGPERRRRLLAIRAAACEGAANKPLALRGQAIVFRIGKASVRIASSQRHLSVHLPSPDLLAGIRARHPELACGRACVKIRDTQFVPVYELREAFRALAAAEAGRRISKRARRSERSSKCA